MKIQLQGQSLRLRIDEAELARLQVGVSIENLTLLPGRCALRQQLQLVDAATPTLQLLEDGFGFGLPADALADYVARLPCRDGLVFSMPIDAASAIEIHFEVDVRDSVKNRGVTRRPR